MTIVPSAEAYAKYQEIVAEIDRRIENVERDTSFHSSHSPILKHADFQWLVEQGDKIIPYLFHLITHEGCSWTIILLLSNLVPDNPIKEEHRGNFYGIIHDWLGWYLRNERRLNDDIYHGLVEPWESLREKR